MSDTMTNGQKEDILEGALEVMMQGEDADGYHYAYVCDFTDTWVVYSCNDGTFQIDYAMDDDGAVTFSGDPMPVYSVTTYEPVSESKSASPMEHRGGRLDMRSLMQVLDARESRTPVVQVRSEPLTYRRDDNEHSYFRDFMLTDLTDGASERLKRHASEMDTIFKAREATARRQLDNGGFEYRVEPNTTTGTGGFFTPPLWLNELFAPARRSGRVLASLIPGTFVLPLGCSSVNLPILTTGTATAPQVPNSAVEDQDIIDAAGTSLVIVIAGNSDNALQLLEQSPAGAHLDWALFQDMTEDYDSQVEQQLIAGLGSASNQLLGITNVANNVDVTYTDGSPTGHAMFPYFGQMAAQIGDGRKRPPEVWLMRTARWSWVTSSEDTADRPLEFPTLNGDDNPSCPGAILGWPAWCDDEIPANLAFGAATPPANQDEIIACRPSDLIFLEGTPQTAVMRVPLSGTLGVRLQLHNSVAFIGNRYPSGIATLTGTGMAVQSSF